AASLSAYADTKGGGFVGVGSSKATVNYNNANTAFVGTPALNVDINAITGEAATPQVNATGMKIATDGNFVLGSTSEMTTSVKTSALGAGFIGVSDGNATTNMHSYTNVIVGSNANINAKTAALNAEVTKIDAFASGSATAGGFAGHADATAENNLNSKTNVLLEGTDATQAIITALQGVDIHALHTGVKADRHADSHWYGLFGGSDDHGTNEGKGTATGAD